MKNQNAILIYFFFNSKKHRSSKTNVYLQVISYNLFETKKIEAELRKYEFYLFF